MNKLQKLQTKIKYTFLDYCLNNKDKFFKYLVNKIPKKYIPNTVLSDNQTIVQKSYLDILQQRNLLHLIDEISEDNIVFKDINNIKKFENLFMLIVNSNLQNNNLFSAIDIVIKQLNTMPIVEENRILKTKLHLLKYYFESELDEYTSEKIKTLLRLENGNIKSV